MHNLATQMSNHYNSGGTLSNYNNKIRSSLVGGGGKTSNKFYNNTKSP